MNIQAWLDDLASTMTLTFIPGHHAQSIRSDTDTVAANACHVPRLLRLLTAWISLWGMSVTTAWASGACEHPIRTAWIEWYPYTYGRVNARPQGLDVELLDAIFKEAGCELTWYGGIPAKRQYGYLIEGRIDMQFAASKTEQRQRELRFSLPYRRELVSAFVAGNHVDHYSRMSLAELLNLNIHFIAPYHGWFGQAFEDARQRLREHGQLHEYLNTSQGLLMMNSEKGDVLIGDHLAFIGMARLSEHNDIVPLPQALNDAPVHLMYNRHTVSDHDVELIDAAIKRLTDKGELRKIAVRYGLQRR